MIKIELKGLDKTIKDINKIASDAKDKGNRAFEKWGDNTRNDAISNLNKNGTNDEGKLRGSINSLVVGLSAEVTVATKYAAYVEFGTKRYAAQYVASLPADWKAYAATFKGKGGGTFDELILAIEQWIKRKGIGETFDIKTRRRTRQGKQSAATTRRADAYAIALKIVRYGVPAQPFVYPAVKKNTPILIKDLKKIFNG